MSFSSNLAINALCVGRCSLFLNALRFVKYVAYVCLSQNVTQAALRLMYCNIALRHSELHLFV